MILELLICTINEGIKRVPDVLLPEVENVRYLVSWQQTGTIHLDLPESLNRPDVRVCKLEGRGLATNRNNALKNALRNAPDQDIKCFTYYYHLNPVGFLISPVSPVFNLNYGGQDHKISIAFFIRNSYSFGVLNSARLSQMQIIAASLQVDAMSATYLKESVGFVFQGNGSR